MLVTLISPYTTIRTYGIRVLSSCLKQAGHEVRMVFLPRWYNQRYQPAELDQVCEVARGSDLIGVSLMTNFYDNAVQLTQRLREAVGAPIVWGGIHATIRPEQCLEHADMACLGEGEVSLVELANRLAAGDDLNGLAGVWFRQGDTIVRNPLRSLPPELDTVPWPDYGLDGHYVLEDGQLVAMDADRLAKHLDGMYVTMATRGCPFGCAYCCNSTLNRMYPEARRVRKRSVESLIGELETVRSTMPFVQAITFDDDSFFTYPEAKVVAFGEQYRMRIGLPLYVTGASPTSLTRGKLNALVESGLQVVRMGIQSASERTKRLYGRTHSNAKVLAAANLIHEFTGRVKPPQYDVIVDNPWEGDRDVVETLRFLTQLPVPYHLRAFSLTMYPGTELYDKARADGLIVDDLTDVYRKGFQDVKGTYLNRLVLLLAQYACDGQRIGATTMRVLTGRLWRALGVGWVLYALLRLRKARSHDAGAALRRTRELSTKAVSAIRRGDWSRIRRYLCHG